MRGRQLAALLAAVGGLAVLSWLSLPWLAGASLSSLARYAGLQEPRFTVSRVGWQQAELIQAHFLLQAAAGTLAVDLEQARLDYALAWHRPVLSSVSIGQVKLAWQASPAAASSSAPGEFSLALPFQHLEVKRLDLDVATAYGRAQFTGALEVDAAEEGGARVQGRLLHGGQAIATLQGMMDAAGAVSADLRLNASLAALSSLATPLLPPQAAPWWPQAGAARGRAQLRRSGDAWSGTAYLEADGVGLTQGALSLADGKLRLTITDLRTEWVDFSAELPSLRLADKLEARQLAFRGQYRSGRLMLQQAGLRLFGGAVDIVPAELDLGRRPLALTLRLTDIDLESLLRSLEQEGLAGTGRIGGELPLLISEAGLAIDGGTLSGNGPGVLRYQGPAADPGNIAFKALRNLAYHRLTAKLDYLTDGEYRLGLSLEGNNPELLAGHPIAFNLNLSGQLSELLRAGLLSGDWGRSILEQAEKQRRKDAH